MRYMKEQGIQVLSPHKKTGQAAKQSTRTPNTRGVFQYLYKKYKLFNETTDLVT